MADGDLPSTEDLVRAFADRPKLSFLLTPAEAFCLLGQLQLALRHPLNTDAAAVVALGLAKRLENHFADDPAIARVAAAGWDPRYDTLPDKETPH